MGVAHWIPYMAKPFALGAMINRIVFLSLWIAGLYVIWLLLPVGGRESWQIPADEFLVGFLSDGFTVVTVARSPDGDRFPGTKELGPVRLWNSRTGALVAEHFSKTAVFNRVLVDAGDMLRLQQEVPGRTGEFQLRLLDARSGEPIQTFECTVPQKNIWWMLSPDGKYSIFQTFTNNVPSVELHDNINRQLVKRLEGWRESLRFSPDGSLFFAQHEQSKEYGIFSTVDGNLVRRFKVAAIPGTNVLAGVKAISPDNTVMVDFRCHVWDLKTGQKRFSVPNINYNSMVFTPDSKYLAVVAKDTTSCWIAWYDTKLGTEDVGRRTHLVDGNENFMHLALACPNPKSVAKYLVSSGTPSITPASSWKLWLSRFPLLGSLGQDQMRDAYVLVNIDTAQVVCTGPDLSASVTPDGQTLVLSDRSNRSILCDIPPKKPVKKYLLLCASFTCLLLLPIAIRRWRGRFNGSHHAPS